MDFIGAVRGDGCAAACRCGFLALLLVDGEGSLALADARLLTGAEGSLTPVEARLLVIGAESSALADCVHAPGTTCGTGCKEGDATGNFAISSQRTGSAVMATLVPGADSAGSVVGAVDTGSCAPGGAAACASIPDAGCASACGALF